uniref:Uncharacterized protein n=1 Tax=Anopheles atroparvus TaxID=41427 RepID=A0AAG5DX00_ANOAO
RVEIQVSIACIEVKYDPRFPLDFARRRFVAVFSFFRRADRAFLRALLVRNVCVGAIIWRPYSLFVTVRGFVSSGFNCGATVDVSSVVALCRESSVIITILVSGSAADQVAVKFRPTQERLRIALRERSQHESEHLELVLFPRNIIGMDCITYTAMSSSQ